MGRRLGSKEEEEGVFIPPPPNLPVGHGGPRAPGVVRDHTTRPGHPGVQDPGHPEYSESSTMGPGTRGPGPRAPGVVREDWDFSLTDHNPKCL